MVPTPGLEQQRYVSRVQPLMVEAMLVVRQPIGEGRDQGPDQRGQLAALEGLLGRVQEVNPPSSETQTHRLIIRGLQRLRSAVRLQLDGEKEQAQRALAEGEETLSEASVQLQGMVQSVVVDGGSELSVASPKLRRSEGEHAAP